MKNTKDYTNLGYSLLFVVTFLLAVGYLSATFLLNTIIPAIGLWYTILIPLAWELVFLGIKTLFGLIQSIVQLPKFIDKDNNN